MLASPPPYSLAHAAFRFRALAALAGRAALGGERESALAVMLAARLAAAMLPPDGLSVALRTERARAAKVWLSSLALPAGVRPALLPVLEASAGEGTGALATALERAVDAVTGVLDAASLAELKALTRALRG